MHLKRLNTPKTWNVPKKKTKFVTKPSPGPHSKNMSIPLVILLRDHLKIVRNKKECTRIINDKLVMVDNLIVKDVKYPVGLFDVVSIPKFKLYYKINLDYKGGLKAEEVKDKEAKTKKYSILNKKRIKKGLIQLNCTTGKNIVLKKDAYKTGDTLIIDLEKNTIVKHIPIEKGATVLVMHGKHAGETAKIKDFKNFESPQNDRAVLETDKKVEYETMKDYVFVIDGKVNKVKQATKKAKKKRVKKAKKSGKKKKIAKKKTKKGGKKK